MADRKLRQTYQLRHKVCKIGIEICSGECACEITEGSRVGLFKMACYTTGRFYKSIPVNLLQILSMHKLLEIISLQPDVVHDIVFVLSNTIMESVK